MNLLMSGATGFIGAAFVEVLLAQGHTITAWVRNISHAKSQFSHLSRYTQITFIDSLARVDRASNFDVVVNLAGAPIADKRWNTKRKKLILDSRIESTKALLTLISQLDTKPSVFLSGSAVGYYGSQASQQPLTENDPVVQGFTHQLCAQWESEALKAETLGVRVCLLRTGIVLGDGGALNKMLLPFKLGLGGRMGSGRQWMSWIHIDDHIAAMLHLIHRESSGGAYNLTSPHPVINKIFSRTLARVLHRPSCVVLPAFLFKIMLGEGSELLLGGQSVVPYKLIDEGFQFNYPDLKPALAQLLNPT